MRPIDADELLKSPLRITGKIGGKHDFEAIPIKSVENAPTLDVVPAAHGRWLKTIMDDYECSNCLYPMDYITPFCPRCGAKMDGEEESE